MDTSPQEQAQQVPTPQVPTAQSGLCLDLTKSHNNRPDDDQSSFTKDDAGLLVRVQEPRFDQPVDVEEFLPEKVESLQFTVNASKESPSMLSRRQSPT